MLLQGQIPSRQWLSGWMGCKSRQRYSHFLCIGDYFVGAFIIALIEEQEAFLYSEVAFERIQDPLKFDLRPNLAAPLLIDEDLLHFPGVDCIDCDPIVNRSRVIIVVGDFETDFLIVPFRTAPPPCP